MLILLLLPLLLLRLSVLRLLTCLRWWVAADADADSTEDEVRSGLPQKVFRTREAALEPGWHEWETNYQTAGEAGEDWRATGLSCLTTVLRQ